MPSRQRAPEAMAGATPRESGRFPRMPGRPARCRCGAVYEFDACLGLPLLGELRYFDEDDDGPVLVQASAAIRRCPKCRGKLVLPQALEP
jgi:hypothetical protein